MRFVVTPSGVDKGEVTENSLIEVNDLGQVLDGQGKPSAETLLHVAIFEETDARVVLHTHSVWNTLVSLSREDSLELRDLEMLKGLSGIRSHEEVERIPILANSQNIPCLAESVRKALRVNPEIHGFLLRGHGLYTWGRDTAEARRHLEVLEFLFEIQARRAGSGDRHGHLAYSRP